MTPIQTKSGRLLAHAKREGCTYSINEDDYLCESKDGVTSAIWLLDGQYEIIDPVSITEEQAKGVVDESDRHEGMYIDYTEDSTRYVYLLKTALSSFHSLLRANGIDGELILKEI